MATIEKRLNADGSVGYRAKVRLRGYPSESTTFERKTDAKEWAKQTEADMRQGRHFKTVEAKKQLLKDWKKEFESNPTQVLAILANSNQDVQDLNAKARSYLKAQGAHQHK